MQKSMTDGELLSMLKQDEAGQTQHDAVQAIIRTYGWQPELYGSQAQCKNNRPPPAVIPSPDSQQSQQQCGKDVECPRTHAERDHIDLSLIHISEPTRLGMISYAVFCL